MNTGALRAWHTPDVGSRDRNVGFNPDSVAKVVLQEMQNF
jgi:hypothetical protein